VIDLLKILLLNVASQDKRRFLMVVILTVISSIFEVFSIGIVIPLITALTDSNKLLDFEIIREIFIFFDMKQSQDLIIPMVVLFIIIIIVSAIVRIWSIKVNANFAFLLGSRLSVKTYHNILHRSYENYKDVNSSKDISRLVSKMNILINGLIFPLIMFFSALLMFVIITSVFMSIDFKLTISVVSGLALIYTLVTIYFKNRLKENSAELSSMQDRQVQVVQESIGNIQDIIINNSFQYFIDIYSDIDKNYRLRQASNVIISQAPRYLIETLSMVFLIIIFYYFAFVNNAISKDMMLPIFITVAIALQKILPISQQLYRSWANIEGNKQSVFDVVNLLNPLKVGKAQDNNISFNRDIVLKNVCFKYENSQGLSLKNINLTIKKGEKIGIVGGTGSGKSTLVDIIMGLLTPTSGEIKIDGNRLSEDNILSWYRHISHVPQSIYIQDSDFYQNIAFGSESKNINKKIVEYSVGMACLDEVINNKENGYKERVGERGSKLSGGQRQRLGIARCIYKDSSLMVLDEATSALDGKTENQVMTNIYNLKEDCAILIIAHKLDSLKGSDRIIELKNGEIENTYSLK
jgi:ATP-binding cassette, subfamily B, bacterial PglK